MMCSCCSRCRCRCRCCCPCPPRETWVCYCSRFIETPMQIYYGPGVTERDLTEESNEYLASIAASLERCCPKRHCC